MKKKINIEYIITIIYLIVLVWLILFKLTINLKELDHIRNINLIPFYYDQNIARFHLKEVIENIIIFIPFGIYFKILKKSNIKTIIYGFITSLSLEILQYIFAIGRSDISDLISNTSGVLLGILLYNIINKIFKNTTKINKVINILAIIFIIMFILLFTILNIAN